MWEWLGEPLAMDFANTIKRRGAEDVDWLRTPADLEEWARLTPSDVPIPAGAGRLDAVRAFRGHVRRFLRAVLDGSPLPDDATEAINAAARAVPVAPRWHDRRAVLSPVGDPDQLDLLLARIAASAIDIAAGRETMAFCDAPSCGTFFVPNRANQQWCGEPCGTRARVARHAARHRGG